METDEILETGYGPGAPAGDNLCNDFAQGLIHAYWSLATTRGDRTDRDEGLALVLADAGSPSLFGNVAVVGRPLGEDEWRAAADRMRRFFAAGPGGPYLLFSAWPTPDLAPLDFGRIGHPPLMVRLPAPLSVNAVDGFEVRPVTDASTAADWEQALVLGFPEPALQPFQVECLLPERCVGAERWRHWVGYLDDEPVGTASAYVGDHHVHVEFISTLDVARGRGIGRALTATATLAAPELPALLISSDLGRSVYERLGYVALLRYTLWQGHRGPAG